jgi:hypothetical protein
MKRFFPASRIARAAEVCSKTIRRRALREKWEVRERGRRREFVPPRSLRRELGSATRPLSIFDNERLLAALRRAVAVYGFVQEARRNPLKGIERALKATPENFTRLFKFSSTALRRWKTAVEQRGLAALEDHRAGKSGRKSARLEKILR